MADEERSGSASRQSILTYCRQHRTFIVGLCACIAALVTFSNEVISLLSTAREKWENLFGSDDQNLVVLRSRLIPMFFVPPAVDYKEVEEPYRDIAELQVCLRNYGAKTIMLTSAEVTVTNSKTARISSILSRGECVLSKDPNEGRPIELTPGQEKWISIAPPLKLSGISRWLTDERLKKINVSPLPPMAPITVGPLTVVKDLNREFANLHGRNAQVNLRLFTGFQTQTRKFSFKLAEGKTIFARDGSLMHDTFIAAWTVREHRPYVALCSACDRSTSYPISE